MQIGHSSAVEHSLHTRRVTGSIPVAPTILYRDIRYLGSVVSLPASEPSCICAVDCLLCAYQFRPPCLSSPMAEGGAA